MPLALQASFCGAALRGRVMITLRPRQNSSAEVEAFDRSCERLAGFNPQLSFEWVEGFLTALAAGPRLPPPDDWVPALCGEDTFERVFADPDDHAKASRALQARLKVLCDALDPELLFEQPDQLRLEPWVADWTDEDRAQLVAEQGFSAEEAANLQIGVHWADGFLSGIDAFPGLWEAPADEQAQALMADAIAQITALTMPPGSDELQAHLAAHYGDKPGTPGKAGAPAEPTRDDLLTEACMAVQDLRMLWVDFAPKPETRRVEATPGRNDPCFCGSGKKYKKCHGGAA